MPLVDDDAAEWIVQYRLLLERREEREKGAARATKSRPRAEVALDAAKALESLGWRVVRSTGEDPRVYLVGAPPDSDVGPLSRAFLTLRVLDADRDTILVGSGSFRGVDDIVPLFTRRQDNDLRKRDAEAARQVDAYARAIADSMKVPGSDRAVRLARVLFPRAAHACRQWLTKHEARLAGKLLPAVRKAAARGRVLAIVTTDDLLRPTLASGLADAAIAHLAALPNPRKST